MTQSRRPASPTTRRTVVAAAGAGGLAAALAACGDSGGDSGDSGGTGGYGDGGDTSDGGDGGEGAEETGGSGGEGAAGEELGAAADVPEGGGMVFKDQKVVVTQPEAGQFKAFSAVCTHEGCLIADVADGTINCACHGSKFSVADGSVANGPATEPLPEETVSVDGDVLRLG